jgi:hypothetical protein
MRGRKTCAIKRKKEDHRRKTHTMVAFTFKAANKQSKHREQSRPRTSANSRFDGSVGVFASLAAVMLPISGNFTKAGTLMSITGQIKNGARKIKISSSLLFILLIRSKILDMFATR